MIRVQADKIASAIETAIAADSPPQKLDDVISACLRQIFPAASAEDILEATERSKSRIIDVILLRQSALNADGFGYFFHVEIDFVSREYIYGACHIMPHDDEIVAKSKARRARASEIASFVRGVSPNSFEKFCYRILQFIGVRKPIVTKSSNDQGIDFFGDWKLETFLKSSSLPAGVESQFRTWIVGQAKKYDKTIVSTGEIRELVGSVALAKSRAFSDDVDSLQTLRIRACDPVFYMFVTTGRITAGVKRILSQAGILFLDSDLLGVFLADRTIEGETWHLSQIEFTTWVDSVVV